MKLFLQRLCADWDASPTALRKSYTYKDAIGVHQSCGMFIYYMEMLQRRSPASEFASMEAKFLEQFMMGVMDADLTTSAEKTVPPGDLTHIGIFRT